MPVSFDSAFSFGGHPTSFTSSQWTHTITTSEDRALMVWIGHRTNTGVPIGNRVSAVSAVAWNGTPVPRAVLAPSVNSAIFAELYFLVAPEAGTHQVEIGWGNVLARGAGAVSISASDVSQTDPRSGGFTWVDPGLSIRSATPTSESDDLVFDVCVIHRGDAAEVGPSQTTRGNVQTGTTGDDVRVYCSQEAGASPNVTMSWQTTPHVAVGIAINLNQASTITPQPPSNKPRFVGQAVKRAAYW
jgi:hypothetical protein